MATGEAPVHVTVRAVVEPDYFQFYARREGAAWASDKVTPEGYGARLWTDGGFVYIGTLRKFGSTQIEVTVRPSKSCEPDVAWQHVAEVWLAPGGRFEIFSWPGDEPVLTAALPAGDVRLRVSWLGLVAGRSEGLDLHGSSDERLSFELWSAPSQPPAVLREWLGWPRGSCPAS